MNHGNPTALFNNEERDNHPVKDEGSVESVDTTESVETVSCSEDGPLVQELSAISLKPKISLNEYKVICSVRKETEAVAVSVPPEVHSPPVSQTNGEVESVNSMVCDSSQSVSATAVLSRRDVLYNAMLWYQSRCQRLSEEMEYAWQYISDASKPASVQLAGRYEDVKVQLLAESKCAERYAEAYAIECHASKPVEKLVSEQVNVHESSLGVRYQWYSMPQDYPRLDVHAACFNIVEYLQRFEQHVQRQRVNPNQYVMLLRQLVDERDRSVDLFIGSLQDSPWEKVKRSVCERFQGQYAKTAALRKLGVIKQGDEPIERYADSYMQLLVLAGSGNDEQACINFCSSLNDECKMVLALTSVVVPKPKTIAEARDRVSMYYQNATALGVSKTASIREFSGTHRKESSTRPVPMEVDEVNPNRQADARSHVLKGSRTCFKCGEAGHYKSECRSKKRVNSSNGGVTKGKINKVKSSYSSGTARYCTKETLDAIFGDDPEAASKAFSDGFYSDDYEYVKSVRMVKSPLSGYQGKEECRPLFDSIGVKWNKGLGNARYWV